MSICRQNSVAGISPVPFKCLVSTAALIRRSLHASLQLLHHNPTKQRFSGYGSSTKGQCIFLSTQGNRVHSVRMGDHDRATDSFVNHSVPRHDLRLTIRIRNLLFLHPGTRFRTTSHAGSCSANRPNWISRDKHLPARIADLPHRYRNIIRLKLCDHFGLYTWDHHGDKSAGWWACILTTITIHALSLSGYSYKNNQSNRTTYCCPFHAGSLLKLIDIAPSGSHSIARTVCMCGALRGC